LVRAVADLLNRMAEERVYHPDTKPGNILVQVRGDEFQLYLVDLDRLRFDARISRTRWIKILARLNSQMPASVSLLDRMRCLRGCSRGRWGDRERRELALRIYRLSLARGAAWLSNDTETDAPYPS
jgi:hypothetical protein